MSGVAAGPDAVAADEEGRGLRRLIGLASLATVGVVVAWLSIDPLARFELGVVLGLLLSGDASGLRDYIRAWGPWGPVVSIVLMIAQALVAPIPSFVITFANGLAYGLFWGWVLSVVGHVIAATVAFGIARAFGRRIVVAFVDARLLARVDRWSERWGAYGILFLRLLPGIAFDAVSFAAGLTRLRPLTFVLATAVGVAPQTLLYSYLGDSIPGSFLALLALSAALVVLIPLVGLVVYRLRAPRPGR